LALDASRHPISRRAVDLAALREINGAGGDPEALSICAEKA
jgi:hypothetical protein